MTPPPFEGDDVGVANSPTTFVEDFYPFPNGLKKAHLLTFFLLIINVALTFFLKIRGALTS